MPPADTHLIPNNYTPVGDLTVVAVCLVMLALIAFSYIRKTAAFRTFLFIIPCLILSALLDVAYNQLAWKLGAVPAVYILRCLFHAALFTVFFLFTLYITEVTHMVRRQTIAVLCISISILLAVIGVDIYTGFRGLATAESGAELKSGGHAVFIIGYLLFALCDVSLLASVRHRLYKRVMWGFYSSVAISFSILLLQRILGGGSSFTVATFLFPVIAMFYIMHSNPYDAEMGTLDSAALSDIVRYYHEKNTDFIFMSLFLPAFTGEGKAIPETIRSLVRKFAMEFFRSATLFNPGSGHLLLLFRKNKNPDYEHRIEKILRAFRDYYRVLQYDYKIVIGESIGQISRKNEYASFIRSIHRTMEDNTVHRITPEDVAAFDRSEYILQELADIHKRHDLNDRRILVYCQPVYNVQSGRYDTAEALMRLQLDDIGLVFPDQFIYLAEDHGFIHTLTEIILHKTCEEIRKLNDSGYRISRISVNVSMLELKEDRFCDDISNIISLSGISGDKIAIELTESRTESEFDVMKAKIEELKEKGLKFYLDDFGTGYSNMERIIELPFDIIKFDRSLVIACNSSTRSEKIVRKMADLFSTLEYSVLYEGIESESDETRCREMAASYLQGYKFSRPVPIAELRRFLDRNNKAG